jgi:hypothetical protein
MADTKTRPDVEVEFNDADMEDYVGMYSQIQEKGYGDVCEVPDRRLLEFLEQRHDTHLGPLAVCRDAVCDALARFGGE